jgi:carbon-monoxide dehydrogenase iron sulfur subunit
MKARFYVNPILCTGCRTCELACSFTHSVNGKPGRSRIYPLATGMPNLWVPVTCLQCDDPACAKSCLVNAITRNPETGAMDLDAEKCVRCMACVAACPFGCSLLDGVNKLVVKCDLCLGDPACAHFCPTKALRYEPVVLKSETA